MMNSTPTTDTKSTSTNTQYSQVEVKSEYTDYSSREEKYGEYSTYTHKHNMIQVLVKVQVVEV